MNKKKLWATVVVTVLAFVGVASFFAYRYYYDRKVPNFFSEGELYVYPETSKDSVFNMILQQVEVKNVRSLKRAFADVEDIKPGHYVINQNHTSAYVCRMLSYAWQTPVKLVLSGTLREEGAIARKIANQMMFDSTAAISAMRDSSLLASLGFGRKDIFALFIPDTYEVYWTESMQEVLQRQKKAYDAFWTKENIEKAKAQGLTQMQASILASIVKGETNYEPEMPSIAGVYLNRLHRGMKLQADPTIAYCLDYKVNRILRKHLEIDSPFNTYKHTGLPPAPIAVPTKAALSAVLNPDRHPYIFFCASPDFNGTHRFAVTYTEHLRNARQFQSALNARQKASR